MDPFRWLSIVALLAFCGSFRVNIKDAIADNTTIWAHGIGFRMNIEFYNPPGLKITRRDVHQSLESMIMSHGFDGRACILRTFCEVSKAMTPKSGILFKLFKLIFRLPEGDDEYFPYLTADDCSELDRHCPISQLDMEGMAEPAATEAVTSFLFLWKK
ncbi:AGAP002978-PA [Anopheles gambiae str. PEST]|uniref:AGAP002978-PA n=1 Tax=Anopheles gambiae TaxID=7165 RepID=A0ND73_ANOGA|nr:AGAP002978-PA [Anopheles gambiae str. PEST]